MVQIMLRGVHYDVAIDEIVDVYHYSVVEDEHHDEIQDGEIEVPF